MILVCYFGMRRVLVRSRRDFKREAEQRAESTIAAEVRDRTAALEKELALFRVFVENTDAIAFEYDLPRERMTYIAPQVAKLLNSASNRVKREFLGKLVHSDDR